MSEPASSDLSAPVEPAELVIPARFCGPPQSGNGGWTSGALAARVPIGDPRHDSWPTVEVTLRQPPPLDTPLTVLLDEATATAVQGEHVVAVARRAGAAVGGTEPTAVEPVTEEEAAAAAFPLPADVSHPFPTCFVCGPDRAVGDGLRLFPGRLTPGRVAVAWTPDPSVAEDFHQYGDDAPRASLPVTWAALDCTGGWAEDLLSRPAVLGRMTARVDALPVIGETHVITGELRGREGRKTFTAATLYDSDGREVATAEHTWISVDPAQFA